jgi:hypothetical protein
MPQIPESAIWALRETDALRLLIRTVAFVERVFDEAFVAALPTREGATWASKLPFGRKLDFVIALGILPPAARKVSRPSLGYAMNTRTIRTLRH